MTVSEPQAIHRAVEQLFNAKDLEGLIELYEKDARMVTPDGSVAEGVDAIREQFTALNPYDRVAVPESILELEPQNFATQHPHRRRQLYAYAIAVLVATGFWNLASYDGKDRHGYTATITVKLILVGLSGIAAAVHSTAKSRALLGMSGGLAALFAIGALFFGIVLAQ